eukprot:CAMPEP_0194442746 /NCGR_PEP_ID=MMETSP0176-20130528/126310_1 /TAXON_ID=216777 /ORGANISM="Proboscia alata, Strain PI-D3" /LENGTH=498 /DNA_ID=CAMNT_0039268895 /DNA_START=68 /DNA_END=1564 /DNA_ORIENTATION=-
MTQLVSRTVMKATLLALVSIAAVTNASTSTITKNPFSKGRRKSVHKGPSRRHLDETETPPTPTADDLGLSPQPQEEDGTRIRKQYSYKTSKGALEITAEYSPEVSTGKKGKKQKDGKKGKRRSERMTWKLRGDSKGFSVDTKYTNVNDEYEVDVERSMSSKTLKLVEFEREDPDALDERYEGQQEVVSERGLREWKEPVLEGGCGDGAADEACVGTFTTSDECLTVTATTNRPSIIDTPLLSLDLDDLKLDYKFGDAEGCGVPRDRNAMALIGSVRQGGSAKAKGKKGDKAVNDEVDTLEGDAEDGVSLFLNWLGQVDCLEKRTIVGSGGVIGGGNPFFANDEAVNATAAESMTNATTTNDAHFSAAVNSTGTRTLQENRTDFVTNDTPPTVPTTNMTTTTNDTWFNQPEEVEWVPVPRAMGVFFFDKVNGDGQVDEQEQIFHWTFDRRKNDVGCVWDPIMGATVEEVEEETSAASPASVQMVSVCAMSVWVLLGCVL